MRYYEVIVIALGAVIVGPLSVLVSRAWGDPAGLVVCIFGGGAVGLVAARIGRKWGAR